jgi:hypothetical protein
MSEYKKNHPRLVDPNHTHHPYWKSAHRGWRAWAGVIVMLTIMLLYVLSVGFCLVASCNIAVAPDCFIQRFSSMHTMSKTIPVTV